MAWAGSKPTFVRYLLTHIFIHQTTQYNIPMNAHTNLKPFDRTQFNYSSLTIRLAHRTDALAIETLRKTAYERSKRINIQDLSLLNWDASHEKHPILVIENEAGELVSTMRGIWVESPEALMKFGNFIPPASWSYPLVILKAGCTKWEYRGLSLNTLLKKELIHHLVGSQATSVVNEINRGSRRIDQMEAMGFDPFVDATLKGSFEDTDPMCFRTPLAIGMLQNAHYSTFVNSGDAVMTKAFVDFKRLPDDTARFSTFYKKQATARLFKQAIQVSLRGTQPQFPFPVNSKTQWVATA